jgi:hypothetical protein
MQHDTDLLQHGTINNVSPCCTLAQPIPVLVMSTAAPPAHSLQQTSLLAMPRLEEKIHYNNQPAPALLA